MYIRLVVVVSPSGLELISEYVVVSAFCPMLNVEQELFLGAENLSWFYSFCKISFTKTSDCTFQILNCLSLFLVPKVQHRLLLMNMDVSPS